MICKLSESRRRRSNRLIPYAPIGMTALKFVPAIMLPKATWFRTLRMAPAKPLRRSNRALKREPAVAAVCR